jgi:hypothetical protein
MNGVHVFERSLAASHAAEDLPFWRECYDQFFPRPYTMVNHRQDGEHQRAGIDRSIVLASSKQILIDEKVRWRQSDGRVFDDIALEFESNNVKRTPGWVCKPLRADFIAYAIAPLGRCFLLPVLSLQLAWQRHSAAWLAKYRTISAPNVGYDTLSLCIPVATLFPALGGALRAQFVPCEAA